ncbi:hypothetical protein A3H22_03185 [Candidatus Peribacteria bacterium RIFCSPLOWO2_12_FULL_55_15]|nr:MAG: hypothetical protein A2789_03390 [Candidatus Peribacteria bacterium RIFCSPHIGHO2_01_FULL_54_22]OGJ63066.1 MAG: hypothetical protein A3D12_00705 [Candidatus Peribacteria bacterium RIFCSPHIGHO2_02_FULL_55_24]OGJ65033.1 MAG: hypothetical protein A3E47_01105 [Candidatus Peribacteria bacterium RIFCSPHIGHO2_12_FULL_54_10]OGJ68938.1 MAG: hypothetical protein A2947_03805 [Candidatus Peribacteria bacterium RIFCSPLOWO2_01_FULL_54_110]OGJ69227.1 MAG: hypothetical protein A3H90_02345 [Candidatus Pe
MDTQRLQKTIHALLSTGKGILAADESSGTIKKRFASISLESTAESRRDYRDMLLRSEGYERHISGVILYDETVDQMSCSGHTFSQLVFSRGVIPGIKTDEGKEEHPFWGPQTVTRGLKGLGERLRAYTERSKGTLGFTKWRQVIVVDPPPSDGFLDYTMHVMAEQAAWSLQCGFVPICEPEILMDGSHSLDQCRAAIERTLRMLYKCMEEQHVDPALTILKTNMALSGKDALTDPSATVATATLKAFHHSLPTTLPGIVFLSGGQRSPKATENLNACALEAKQTNAPWVITFSYGRALQDDALKLWGGKAANVLSAQAVFLKRARLNGLAQQGKYDQRMEKE